MTPIRSNISGSNNNHSNWVEPLRRSSPSVVSPECQPRNPSYSYDYQYPTPSSSHRFTDGGGGCGRPEDRPAARASSAAQYASAWADYYYYKQQQERAPFQPHQERAPFQQQQHQHRGQYQHDQARRQQQYPTRYDYNQYHGDSVIPPPPPPPAQQPSYFAQNEPTFPECREDVMPYNYADENANAYYGNSGEAFLSDKLSNNENNCWQPSGEEKNNACSNTYESPSQPFEDLCAPAPPSPSSKAVTTLDQPTDLLNDENGVESMPSEGEIQAPEAMLDPNELQPNDIVCGRGAPTNFHPGNEWLRSLIKKHQTQYLCAKRSDKPVIATKLLDQLRAEGRRFVRRVKCKGLFRWEEIDEKRAFEKICQFLRDGAPELRRKLLASTKVRTTAMENKRQRESYTPLPWQTNCTGAYSCV